VDVVTTVVCSGDSLEWYNSTASSPQFIVDLRSLSGYTTYSSTGGVTQPVAMPAVNPNAAIITKYSITCGIGCNLDPHIIIMGPS
jgi:hypothetical protein